MHVELYTEPDDEYLTDPEIKCLIQQLSEVEMLKLGQIAKIFSRKTGGLIETNELLNEAIVVIASGKRKFPRQVPLLGFFAGTMKSIVFNEMRKAKRILVVVEDDPENDPILNAVDQTIDVENEAIADQALAHIYELVKDDDEMTLLVMARCDGLSPDEVCGIEDWNRTKYNSVQKRLRRTLNKHFPNGKES
jgi:DNA-directed RNA polymerase specialized sigma24 family protein